MFAMFAISLLTYQIWYFAYNWAKNQICVACVNAAYVGLAYECHENVWGRIKPVFTEKVGLTPKHQIDYRQIVLCLLVLIDKYSGSVVCLDQVYEVTFNNYIFRLHQYISLQPAWASHADPRQMRPEPWGMTAASSLHYRVEVWVKSVRRSTTQINIYGD